MKKKKNIPELRFPDFSGEWERKKLGEFAEINPKSEKLPKSFIYIDLESVVKGHLEKEVRVNIESAPSRAQRLLQKHDIIFQMVRPYQKNNFIFQKDSKDYVASTGYAQFRTKYNPMFLYQLLHIESFVNTVIEKCTGTSFPAINSFDLSEINVNFPSLPEQKKIANFLTSIDERLLTLKKKKTTLEQYKKGVMQKIFSQELRFKDEKGKNFPKWESKRLGEVAEFYKGSGISKANITINGLTECITYGELYTRYGEVIDIVYSRTDLPINSLIMSEGNEVIMPSSGETHIDIAKASCVLRSGVAIGGDLNIIKTKVNGVFLSYYLNVKRKNEIANLAQGGSVIHLYSSQLTTIKVDIPNEEEQKKIADFLSSIDDKIDHCKKEIEKTELYKKGLLQKMFV